MHPIMEFATEITILLISTLCSAFDLFKNLLMEEGKKEDSNARTIIKNSNNSEKDKAEKDTIKCDLCGKHFKKRGIKIHLNACTRNSKNL